MTVYKIGSNRINLALTDSEVLSLFGAYEKLNAMSDSVRMTVALLLKEGLSDCKNKLDGELLVEIRARKSIGCIIAVSPALPTRKRQKAMPIMLEFPDSESMINGILILYGTHRFRIKSSLYKMPCSYRLTVLAKSDDDTFALNEFCIRQSRSPCEIAYTEEYGIPLAKDDAVERIGKAFFKGF